jgi:hypothetical protein
VFSFRSSDCEIAEANPFGFFRVSLARKELAFLTLTVLMSAISGKRIFFSLRREDFGDAA